MSVKYRGIIFLLVLGIKLVTVYYLSSLAVCGHSDRAIGSIALSAGDTFSYTGAMENYIQHGTYFFEDGGKRVYAGRLVHYAIPYLAFRQILDQRHAYDVLIIFQVLLESIAIVVLGLIAIRIIKKKYVFEVTIGLMLISLHWTNSAYYANPESLSVSLLIFFVWQYIKYITSHSIKNLVWTGLFIGLLVTLKSYFILLFMPIGLHFIYHELKSINAWKAWQQVFLRIILVSFPMILLLTPWGVRNYYIHKQFIPLQISTTAGYTYTQSDFACRRFIMAWGGNILFWEKNAAGCYFVPHDDLPCQFEFPYYAFAKGYNLEEVEEVRNLYVELQHDYSLAKDKAITQRFDSLTTFFKKDKPFRFYILSRLILMKKFLTHSGSYFLPISSSSLCYVSYQLIIKVVTSLCYWVGLVVGGIGLYFMILRDFSNTFIIGFIPIYLIVLFPLLLRATEWRFFDTAYPFMMLGVVYVLAYAKEQLEIK